MDNNNRYENDRDIYQTGSTRPPKKHGGLMAFLLISVIFLGGIASAMGILNARLVRQITEPEDSSPMVFSSNDTQASEDTLPEKELPGNPGPSRNSVTLNISDSPKAVENIPEEGGLSLQQIYTNSIDSVVSISCNMPNGRTTGTGVVLTSDGYIVTNSHVVEGARQIQVLFTNQEILTASIVGMDTLSDLAVLYVDAQELIPAEFGDSNGIRVGDKVVAIGDPLGLELRGTMTDGIISAINRDITTGGRTMTLLQTNAALNSGNSGGPLLNCYGQVIGINTMKIGDYVNSSGVEGLGFAIPSTTVKEVVDQLISQGYVTGRPNLGITGQAISPLYQQLYRLPQGIFITEVEEDSDAQNRGISPGDVLVSFDGKQVADVDTLNTLLYNHQAGDTVKVVVFRSDKSYEIPLTIGQAN